MMADELNRPKIGTPLHELRTPIGYTVAYMKVCMQGENRNPGVIVHILKDDLDNYEALLPGDDYNFTRKMGMGGVVLMGRGVLIEKVWVDEWFVAWRPFAPEPKVDDWDAD